jgi:hypothetical protein
MARTMRAAAYQSGAAAIQAKIQDTRGRLTDGAPGLRGEIGAEEADAEEQQHAEQGKPEQRKSDRARVRSC